MEIITIKKPTATWETRLLGLEVNGELKVDLKNAHGARECISRRMKIYHPHLEFTTKKNQGIINGKIKSFVLIRRIA